MANFCYDQYEHPLLWCDEKRRLVERKDLNEGLREVKRRKEAERVKIVRDRNEVNFSSVYISTAVQSLFLIISRIFLLVN